MFLKNLQKALVLGRWSTTSKYSIVNKKIDFSNTDNCYGLGFYHNNNMKNKITEEEIIFSMYCYSDYMDSNKKEKS